MPKGKTTVAVPAAYRCTVLELEVRAALARITATGRDGSLKRFTSEIGWSDKDFLRKFQRKDNRDPPEPEDLGRMAAFVGRELGIVMPPGWPIHTLAEWERHQALTGRIKTTPEDD